MSTRYASEGIGPAIGSMVAGMLKDKGADLRAALARSKNLGLSPRQRHLNRLWATYKCVQYDARSVEWDGRERLDPVEAEAVMTGGGAIPPGFYGAAEVPLRFRRPSTPYHLAKVIVDRFTGMLFSERRHPQIRVEGDPDTEDFVHALVERARLWQAMIQARTFGGATGSVAIGFQFVDGVPVVEVWNTTWCSVEFKDRVTHRVKKIERRFQYDVDVQDPETGEWITARVWYRRVVDETKDTLYAPALVGDGDEPSWQVEDEVEHGFGFCPWAWIQNLPEADDLDGDSDCHGIYDILEQIDALLSQAHRGVISNCDPTVRIVSKDEIPEIVKGSMSAIKINEGSVDYMELSGTGPKAATEMADRLRELALEVAQCVLDHPEGSGAQTATEIKLRYSSMLSKVDVMKEQYGMRGIVPLVEMMVRAARKLAAGRPGPEGETIVGTLDLPLKVDDETGERVKRKLGPGGQLKLDWPPPFEPALADVNQAVMTAVAAKSGGLIDDEHATKFVAPYLDIDDASAMVERVKAGQPPDPQGGLDDLAMGGGAPPGELPAAGEGGGGVP